MWPRGVVPGPFGAISPVASRGFGAYGTFGRRVGEAGGLKKTGLGRYVGGVASLVLVLVPAVFAFLYVYAFGVSVIFSDAWSMAPLFEAWSSGTFGPSQLFAQHNEHRMFFPKGVELLLGSVTAYDNVAEMYLIQVCSLVTLGCLVLAFRGRGVGGWWLVLLLPVSLLLFSFRQYENMLFGFQLNFAFTQMFGVLALSLLFVAVRSASSTRPGLTAAIVAGSLVSATVASFSTAQGLFVWPAGLLLLLLGPAGELNKKIWVPVWALIGALEWVFYFAGFSRSGEAQPLSYAFLHPVQGAEYLFKLLGSPIFWRQDLAFAAGLLVLCLAAVGVFASYRAGKLGQRAFWVALLLYALLIAASITLGRSGFGPEQAMAPRYTAFSLLAAASVYALLASSAFERRSIWRVVPTVLLGGVVLFGAADAYPRGVEVGERERVSRERAAFVLATYETQPDELLTRTLHPRARVVRQRAPILQELGYNVFDGRQGPGRLPPLSDLRETVPGATASGYNVSAAGISREEDGTVVVPEDAPFMEVTGWAVDAANEDLAGGVYVEVDGEPFAAFYGADRGDVAEALGDGAYRYSGFERAVPLDGIGAGEHELSVVVLAGDGEGYERSNRAATFEVR